MVGIPPIYGKIGDGGSYCFTNTNANSYEFVEPAKGIERDDLNSLQDHPHAAMTRYVFGASNFQSHFSLD